MKNAGIKIDRKVVCSEANAMFANTKGISRAEAMAKAHKVAKIYAAFAAGLIATVTFVKGDGTERLAKMLPAKTGEFLINGNGTNHTPKANILFVDADLGEFRSCVKSRILTVVA